MEEESGAVEAEQPAEVTEAEQPVDATEAPQDEDEIDVTQSVILEEDGPTTRKIQTDFTIPLKGPAAEAAASAAAAAKGGQAQPLAGPVFQPCGDMPKPPGADPMQWGFPEFCPRKMMRYAEAAAAVAEAAAAAAEAPDTEVALPGAAADTPFDEAGGEEPGGDSEPAAEEVAEEEAEPVNLSALSAVDEQFVPIGEEVVELEKSSSDVYMDAIGMEEHEEWYSDSDLLSSSEAFATIRVDIEVAVPSAGVAHEGSVEFQAPAAAEEAESPQEEAAPEQQPPQVDERKEEEGTASSGALQPQYPQQMDATDATSPVLWKIEQDIAVVRTKLSEMQQKITALDIPDVAGGIKPAGLPARRKCVCDPQKRGLPAAATVAAAAAAVATAAPTPTAPTMGAPPEDIEKLYHSAPCLQQFSHRRSFATMAHDLKPFPQQFAQMGGGVDIYIASRSGNTSAVTSINPANFQQYAEKPVLKAFTSPDVDVYVVTDNVTAPGYSGQQ